MNQPLRYVFCLLLLVATISYQNKGFVAVAYADDHDRDSKYVAPFVPTPEEVVVRMLELAEIRSGDVLYDLGSGDGRIVFAAAKRYGIKAVGFEIDPALVKISREFIKQAGLEKLAEIRDQDVFTVDFSPASVVTMYLYPGAVLRLRPALRSQLKPGSRVVSHNYGMGDWQPVKTEQVKDSAGLTRTLYLWRIEAGRSR
ncbi:MAG: class I SAM-dependent methyltransferase [Deltaproteobacteria bacterium]|nr:class I SAM-dependent methyltransferase [Deltaproteobacteria bacterium]